jgi:hypothetical protein
VRGATIFVSVGAVVSGEGTEEPAAATVVGFGED